MTNPPAGDAVAVHHRNSGRGDAAPLDPRNPGDEYLQREIDRDRRSEHWLLAKAAVAAVVVALLVTVRELVFR